MPRRARLAILLTSAILVVACGSPAPSPEPVTSSPPRSVAPSGSASAAPSDAPTPRPTASPAAPSAGVTLRRDAYARVVTSDLRVRSKPGTGADSEIRQPLLQEGVLLLVVDGPVEASGFQWYQVQSIVPFEADGFPFGWVAAAGQDGERWLEPASINCPPTPGDVASLALLNETEQSYFEITCFSGIAITVEGRLATPEAMCGIDVPWGVDPEWLDPCRRDNHYLVPVDGNTDRPFFPTWMPGTDFGFEADPGAPPEAWPVVRVTGQFDHEASQTCRTRQNYAEEGLEAPDPALVVLRCRTQFVVTSLEHVAG